MTRFPALVLLICLLASPPQTSFGQSETAPPPDLSHAQKGIVIERLIKRIEDFYVIQDEASAIANRIRENATAGNYDDIDNVNAFARQLTLDLREVSGDAHFALLHNPGTFQAMESELSALEGPDSRKVMKEWLEDDEAAPDIGDLGGDARQNYFFRKLEVLDGNVGYLRLDRMPDLVQARPTLDAAMAFLANTDALILDLRDNPGGVGGFIPYLMSYFFSEGGISLYRREFPAVEVVDEYFTETDLPGRRLTDIPLYVLMNARSGSAARNLSYTLQAFGRAVLVGQASGVEGGGAHSGGLFPLADGLLAIVPIGRVVNTRTGTNWRDGGVVPDVAVESGKEPGAAHQMALEALLEQATDPAITRELTEALAGLEASQGDSETAAENP